MSAGLRCLLVCVLLSACSRVSTPLEGEREVTGDGGRDIASLLDARAAADADAGDVVDAALEAGAADAGDIVDAALEAGAADAGDVVDAALEAGAADAGACTSLRCQAETFCASCGDQCCVANAGGDGFTCSSFPQTCERFEACKACETPYCCGTLQPDSSVLLRCSEDPCT